MSQLHQFICNSCGEKASGEYNGEHWLPPKKWGKIVDRDIRMVAPYHDLCESCVEIITLNNLKFLVEKAKKKNDKSKKKTR